MDYFSFSVILFPVVESGEILFNCIFNSVIWSLQSEITSEHDVRRAE